MAGHPSLALSNFFRVYWECGRWRQLNLLARDIGAGRRGGNQPLHFAIMRACDAAKNQWGGLPYPTSIYGRETDWARQANSQIKSNQDPARQERCRVQPLLRLLTVFSRGAARHTGCTRRRRDWPEYGQHPLKPVIVGCSPA